MMGRAGRGVFMRMFSSALASQAVLSAASFAVALLLIRRTPDLEFAHYVLVLGAIILAVSLQNSFIGPAMINRMTRLGRTECGELTGGLYREQRRVVVVSAGAVLAATLLLWAAQWLDGATAVLVLAAIAAMVAALRREYFRLVLLAYRRAQQVLRADIAFCVLLVSGVLLATFSPAPAATAVLASGFAALVASSLLSRTLRRSEAWDAGGAQGILREIAPLATWSTSGAAIHWTFSQGYTYLVAATLDVRAVAAIAATRLLAMPVNLLSSGIGSLMLPLTSRWLAESGAPLVLRRLVWLALGIAAAAIGYFTVLWLLRDWVFDVMLKKNFAQRDLLLMLWSAAFVLMVVHQQLLYLLIARERFRLLTPLALISAVVALVCSLWGMQRYGGAGAVLGIVLGELTNTIGVVILCLREIGLAPPLPAQPATVSP
jgi:O-antigen/teichoic acid export membrane protein